MEPRPIGPANRTFDSGRSCGSHKWAMPFFALRPGVVACLKRRDSSGDRHQFFQASEEFRQRHASPQPSEIAVQAERALTSFRARSCFPHFGTRFRLHNFAGRRTRSFGWPWKRGRAAAQLIERLIEFRERFLGQFRHSPVSHVVSTAPATGIRSESVRALEVSGHPARSVQSSLPPRRTE